MKNQAEPDEQSRKDASVIYEEIDERPQVPKPLYTSENIAYSHLHHSNIVPHPTANNN